MAAKSKVGPDHASRRTQRASLVALDPPKQSPTRTATLLPGAAREQEVQQVAGSRVDILANLTGHDRLPCEAIPGTGHFGNN